MGYPCNKRCYRSTRYSTLLRADLSQTPVAQLPYPLESKWITLVTKPLTDQNRRNSLYIFSRNLNKMHHERYRESSFKGISKKISRFFFVTCFAIILFTFKRLPDVSLIFSGKSSALDASFHSSSTVTTTAAAAATAAATAEGLIPASSLHIDDLRKKTEELFHQYKTRMRDELLEIHRDTGLPMVLHDQILKDLRPFQGVVVKKKDLLTVDSVVKIQDSQVTMVKGISDRWNMKSIFRALQKGSSHRLKNVSTLLAFNFQDSGIAINPKRCKETRVYDKILKYHGLDRKILDKEPYNFPIFSICKISSCFDDVLIPYQTLFIPVDKFEENYNLFKNRKPWGEKKNQAVWRGSTTGSAWSEGRNHRYRMAVHCDDTNRKRMRKNKMPLYDIFFYRHTYFRNWPLKEIKNQYIDDLFERKLIRPDKHVKGDQYYDNFTVLLDMDGFGFTDRFPRLQFRETAMVKMGLFDDILSRSFIDGVHLFHPSIELTELDEIVEWLIKNKDLAEEMMILRRELFFKVFNKKNMDRYMVELVRFYADYVTVID